MLGGLHIADLFPRDPEAAVIRKIRRADKCLGCHIERAVGIGYLAGETTNPDGAIPLCPPCLYDFEHGDLDVWDELELPEIRFAIIEYGSAELARRALMPGDYLRTIERARDEAA